MAMQPGITGFQFHLVRLKDPERIRRMYARAISIPFSTIKSHVLYSPFAHSFISIPFSTIKREAGRNTVRRFSHFNSI